MQVKRTVRTWLGRGLTLSRIHHLALRRTGVVVAFHRVSDVTPEDDLTRSSSDFNKFCRFFADHFHVVSLREFITRLERGQSVGGVLAITFDDGYLDNYEVAAPILDQYGLPATFFIATRFIASTRVPWWDSRLTRQPGWMSWSHVRDLAAAGFDIGGHTRTHVDLGVTDGEVADEEIVGSRLDIHENIGCLPAHFAYPYGQQGNLLEVNRDRVRAAGYRCCVSCHGGTASSVTDPFRLQRVPISPWYRTPEEFAFEVATGRA
ncbi:MAG TPA: polysaccharide deacetylase family protein [Gemmatimonadaceae bacterium]|nr:polysaccharide deacetylase family protein [Gemmatimonadaceae bacterium]